MNALKALFIIILSIIILSFSACRDDDSISETTLNKEATQPPSISNLATKEDINLLESLILTPEEQIYLDQLRDKGVLKVASSKTKGTYQPNNGKIEGYNYLAVSKFASDLSVTLDVHVVDSLRDYFMNNGLFNATVQTDPSISYTPDLLEEVDIYVDLLTPLPWRQKLIQIIEFLPVRETIVYHKGLEIKSMEDLNNLTVAINPVSSYNTTLEETALKHNLNLNYVKTHTSTETIALVNSGQADFTILDSNWAFLEVDAHDHLVLGQPITDIQHVGWAIKKEDAILGSILEKYWTALKDSGIFNDFWLTDYSANYYDYYKLISSNLSAVETIQFTPEEEDYLKALQNKGVFKVANSDSKISFNLVDGKQKAYYYLLIKDFTDALDIDLDVIHIDEFSMLFWKNGQTPAKVKSDPTYTYRPDLMNEVDMYLANITILPWRQQILNQIPIAPAKPVFVLHKESDIRKIEDLDGKTVAINKDTSFEIVIQKISEDYNLSINTIAVGSDKEGYNAVENKEVDATMIDSDLGLLILQDYNNLVISFSASEISDIGWAVKKEDKILASILSKYIEATKQNGKFEEYWNETYDISYIEYLRLLTD